jgi:hypothetical protein
MDAEAVLLEKVKKNQAEGGHATFDEDESRMIQLLIENETLQKKAFAFKRHGKEALLCIQNPRIDPFTARTKARLG